MALVEWLHHGRLARDVAGGKGASLSDLQAAGFPVPEAFVITADAYRQFITAAGLDAKIDDLLRSSDATTGTNARDLAATIMSLVLQTSLPGELSYLIGSAYEVLATTSGSPCAVRSSATDEDGAERSMAGLYETYLNVRGTAGVLDAVRRCYASLWSERAVRHRAGRPNALDAAMAVVVMQLVPCETSGVAFTAHPITGDTNVVVINSSWGLGESIVSGSVTPDSFVVHKDTLTIEEREIFEKESAIYALPDVTGTTERPVDPMRALAPSLTDEQVIELVATATKIETYYSRPQDVEWGIAHGRLYVLQSRPITTI